MVAGSPALLERGGAGHPAAAQLGPQRRRQDRGQLPGRPADADASGRPPRAGAARAAALGSVSVRAVDAAGLAGPALSQTFEVAPPIPAKANRIRDAVIKVIAGTADSRTCAVSRVTSRRRSTSRDGSFAAGAAVRRQDDPRGHADASTGAWRRSAGSTDIPRPSAASSRTSGGTQAVAPDARSNQAHDGRLRHRRDRHRRVRRDRSRAGQRRGRRPGARGQHRRLHAGEQDRQLRTPR